MPRSIGRPADLQVQQLYTFRQVYEMGGYAAAASKVGLSVPTVWQHIQAVERSYETRLFTKVGRRIQPTAAAHRLYKAVDEILQNLESTFDLLNAHASDQRTVRLVSGNRMMLEDLAKPLSVFRDEFGHRLMIRHGNNKRAEELLLADEADLALSLEAGPGKASDRIHYEPAYFVDFLVVAPKGHPFAASDSTNLRELVRHPLIVTAPGTHGRDALDQALYRERLEANIVVETDNSGFTIACVQAGMGLGILAGRVNGSLCRNLATRSLRSQLGRRQIVVMWHKGRRLSDSLIRLIELVKAVGKPN